MMINEHYDGGGGVSVDYCSSVVGEDEYDMMIMVMVLMMTMKMSMTRLG